MKTIMAFRTLLVSLALSFCFATSTWAEITEADARAMAKEAVRKTQSDPAGYRSGVEAIRREDIEWRIFGAQVKVKGRIAVPVYVYELSLTGYEILSPDEHVFFAVVDADPSWLVAVLRSDGELFRLAGFREAEAEFNRMAARIEFKIPQQDSPDSWVIDFLELTTGEKSGGIYGSSLLLRHSIEKHFHWEYSPGALSRKLFSQWWRKHGKQVEKLKYEYEVENREDRFLVRVVKLRVVGRPLPPIEWQSSLEAPRVEEWTIEVFPDGRCRVAAKKILVGPPAGS